MATLHSLLDDEHHAISAYGSGIKKYSDEPKTVKLLHHIQGEEKEHASELKGHMEGKPKMAKKFIQSAIKHPGRIKALAKRKGISTHAEAVQASHSKDKSLRGAGNLAIRFQKGGDLHGGSTILRPDSLKAETIQGRSSNMASKLAFRGGTYARTSDGRDSGEYQKTCR